MRNGGKSPIILKRGTLKLEQGNKSLKVTTLRVKSTLLISLATNTQGVGNGKLNDSPDVGRKVFNSDETERNTLKRLKRDFVTHQKHFPLDIV